MPAKESHVGGSRRSGRPRRSLDEILDCAAAIFREKGFDGTSIQEIADALGILKGTLYYHVKSKEELLFRILYRGHQAIHSSVEDVPTFPGDPLSRIRLFVERDVFHAASNLSGVALFFHDFRSLTDEHRAELVVLRDKYDRLLRRLIEEGQSTGSVCPDIDPKLLAIEILTMKNSVAIWYHPEGPLTPAALAAEVADFVVAGLACDPATHVPGHRRSFAAVDVQPPGPLPVASREPVSGEPAADHQDSRRGWFRRRRG